MNDDDAPPQTRPHRATGKSHRAVRAEALQKALRDNLRRRKAPAGPDDAPAGGEGQARPARPA